MSLFSTKDKTLDVGDSIPSFTLRNQYGGLFDSNEDLKDKFSVIYFYPKDESGICTKEACAFRDNYQVFTDANIEVIGINSANSASHKKFQDKNRLPFTLLSDPGNKVLKQFGVKNTLFLTGRETFIVDKRGIIVHRFRDFLKGDAHVSETLKFISKAQII